MIHYRDTEQTELINSDPTLALDFLEFRARVTFINR